MTQSEAGKGSSGLFGAYRALRRRLTVSRKSGEDASRWHRILLNFGASILGRGIAITCSLGSIPLAMHYLGVQRYGIWATLTGSITLLTFLDLGLSIGLQNRISAMIGSNMRSGISRAVRSSIALSGILSSLFSISLLGVIWKTPLVEFVFRSPAFENIKLRECLTFLVVSIVTALPLNMAQRIALGLQRGWLLAVGNAITAVFTLTSIVIASHLAVDLPVFVAIAALPPVISNLILLCLLHRIEPEMISLNGSVSLEDGLRSLKNGASYCLPQISGAILTQAPTTLLGTLGVPSAAALFNVLSRLSSPFVQIQQMLLLQTWPTLTEAIYRKDVGWLTKTVRNLVGTSLASSAGGSVLLTLCAVCIPQLISPDHSLQLSIKTALVFAIYIFLFMVTQALAFINNSLEATKSQNVLAFINILFVAFVLPKCAAIDVDHLFIALASLSFFCTAPALLIELKAVIVRLKS